MILFFWQLFRKVVLYIFWQSDVPKLETVENPWSISLCYTAVRGRCIVNWLNCTTQAHETAWVYTDICLLVRRSAWNVREWSGRRACGEMCVASKQSYHEVMRNVTTWKGLGTPSSVPGIMAAGYGDLRQACGLLVLNRVNRPCLHSSRMTITHPNTYSPFYSPTCPANFPLNEQHSIISDGVIVISSYV